MSFLFSPHFRKAGLYIRLVSLLTQLIRYRAYSSKTNCDSWSCPSLVSRLWSSRRSVAISYQRYSALWRIFLLSCAEDVTVGGFLLPKGTIVIPNIWAVHQDARHWKNPDTFNPERFLTEDGTELLPRPDRLIPFSVGKRLVVLGRVSTPVYYLLVVRTVVSLAMLDVYHQISQQLRRDMAKHLPG